MNTLNPINQQMHQAMIELYNACSEIESDTNIKVKTILNNAIKIFQYAEAEDACSLSNKLKKFKLELLCKIEVIELQKKGYLEFIIKTIEISIDKFETMVGMLKREHELKRKREESNENEPNKRCKMNQPQNEVKNNPAAAIESQEDAERKAAEERGDADMELAKMLMECDDIERPNQFDADRALAKKSQENEDMQLALQIQEAETQSARQRRMPFATNNHLNMAIGRALVEAASCPPKAESLEESMMSVKQVTKNDHQFFS